MKDMLGPFISVGNLVSPFPFCYNTFFDIVVYVVGITIIISCVYLCAFFIKKLIMLLKKTKIEA